MTDRELDVAVAKKLQWREVGVVDGKIVGIPPGETSLKPVPFYSNDLNEINAVENKLNDKDYAVFSHQLEAQFPYGGTIRAKSASARIRVLAFLRV